MSSNTVIYQDKDVRITARTALSPDHKSILLSFTGIGHQMAGMNVQQDEFYRAGSKFDNIFFVTDLKRTWGNGLDFETIGEVTGARKDGVTVCAIGNSMGGFLAVAASTVIPMERVMAISPQFSMDKSIVPEEIRWSGFASRIAEFKIPSLKDRFVDGTEYYLASGNMDQERAHWSRFPRAPNIYNLIFIGTGHHVADEVKARGQLPLFVEKCLVGRLTLGDLKQICPAGVTVI